MDRNNPEKILIVDDAPDNIDILGEALAMYTRVVALNGPQALKIASGSSPPDLILLDIVMPEMDGYEVCRRLKKNPATREIPVIFVTGKSSFTDETKGLELGAVALYHQAHKPTSSTGESAYPPGITARQQTAC